MSDPYDPEAPLKTAVDSRAFDEMAVWADNPFESRPLSAKTVFVVSLIMVALILAILGGLLWVAP